MLMHTPETLQSRRGSHGAASCSRRCTSVLNQTIKSLRGPRQAPATAIRLSGQSRQRAARGTRLCSSANSNNATAGLALQDLKAQLAQTVTRLNSESEADDPALQAALLSLVAKLAAANPTPRPAESALINGTWALLYTLPGAAQRGRQRNLVQEWLATLYDFFYKYAPILAGSAVGRNASSRNAVRARGQFQEIDTSAAFVSNRAAFEALGRPGEILVDGTAGVAPGAEGQRLAATFTTAELRWGGVRVPFPIGIFAPSGYIDTLYLDADLRVSQGDKGSLFVARRVGAGG